MKQLFLIGVKKIFSQNYFYRKNYKITNQSFLFEQIKFLTRKKNTIIIYLFGFNWVNQINNIFLDFICVHKSIFTEGEI